MSYFSLTQINSISDRGMFSFIFLKELVPQVNIWKLLILRVSNCIPKLHICFLRLINIFCTVFLKYPSMMILLISCAQSIWQGNWLLTSPAQQHAFHNCFSEEEFTLCYVYSPILIVPCFHPIYSLDYKQVGPIDLYPELVFEPRSLTQSVSLSRFQSHSVM